MTVASPQAAGASPARDAVRAAAAALPYAIGLVLAFTLNGTFDPITVAQPESASIVPLMRLDRIVTSASAAGACALWVLACLVLKRSPRMNAGWAVVLCAGCLSMVANNFLALPETWPHDAIALGITSGFSMLLLIWWADAAAHLGSRMALAALAEALLISIALDLLTSAFIPGATTFIIGLAPFACPALYLWLQKRGEGGSNTERTALEPHGAAEAATAAAESVEIASSPSPTRDRARARSAAGKAVCALVWMALCGFIMARAQEIGSNAAMEAFVASPIDWRTILGSTFSLVICLALIAVRHPLEGTRLFMLAALAAVSWLMETVGFVNVTLGVAVMCCLHQMAFCLALLIAASASASGEEGCRPPRSTFLNASFMFAAAWGLYLLAMMASTSLSALTLEAGTWGNLWYNAGIALALVVLLVMEIAPRMRREDSLATGEAEAPHASQASLTAVDPALFAAFAQSAGLSERETEVAELLLEGLTTSQAAQRLGMGVETAKTHVRRIYRKAQVHSREELAQAVSESAQ